MRLSGRKQSLSARPWRQRQRVVLLALIGANAAAFVAQMVLEACQPGVVREYLALSDRGLHDAYSWQFVTAIFLHFGPAHFLVNTFLLYLLGRDIESILGQGHFFYLYLAGAIGGEFSHLFLMPAGSVLFGASGGVAAVVVAYATILPELELISTKILNARLRLKAKHVGCAAAGFAVVFLCINRSGAVGHGDYLGGCIAGWLYANLLGFGRPSVLQRVLRQRRVAAERYRQLTPDQIIAEEIDPLLEKISRCGMKSLTRTERRILARAHQRIMEQVQLR
jgi:membrane associated rhomboid family serine protease